MPEDRIQWFGKTYVNELKGAIGYVYHPTSEKSRQPLQNEIDTISSDTELEIIYRRETRLTTDYANSFNDELSERSIRISDQQSWAMRIFIFFVVLNSWGLLGVLLRTRNEAN